MRKRKLQQTIMWYLKNYQQGALPVRRFRRFVLQKFLHDLLILGLLPPNWQALTIDDVQRLVAHWKKKKLGIVTLMKYLTIIRHFLQYLNCPLAGIDNPSLGLIRTKPQRKNSLPIHNKLRLITHSLAKIVLDYQQFFGLTLKEIMHLVPGVHGRSTYLWLTHEITFNQQDRVIPFRFPIQFRLWQDLQQLISVDQSLMTTYGQPILYSHYRQSLALANLPLLKTYRFLYAQWLLDQLAPTLSYPKIVYLIQQEMGLKSRTTVWNYLHEPK